MVYAAMKEKNESESQKGNDKGTMAKDDRP